MIVGCTRSDMEIGSIRTKTGRFTGLRTRGESDLRAIMEIYAVYCPIRYVVVPVRATVGIRSLYPARVREAVSAAHLRGAEGALRRHVPCPSKRVERDVRNGVPRLPARPPVCIKVSATSSQPCVIALRSKQFAKNGRHSDRSTLRQHLNPSASGYDQDLAEVVRWT
jgi:hypothetical protein